MLKALNFYISWEKGSKLNNRIFSTYYRFIYVPDLLLTFFCIFVYIIAILWHQRAGIKSYSDKSPFKKYLLKKIYQGVRLRSHLKLLLYIRIYGIRESHVENIVLESSREDRVKKKVDKPSARDTYQTECIVAGKRRKIETPLSRPAPPHTVF